MNATLELAQRYLARNYTPAPGRFRARRGLLVGVAIDDSRIGAPEVCAELLAAGILAKDTRGRVLRFSPPLIVTPDELDWAAERIEATFRRLDSGPPSASRAEFIRPAMAE